jgi:hypothetical protein
VRDAEARIGGKCGRLRAEAGRSPQMGSDRTHREGRAHEKWRPVVRVRKNPYFTFTPGSMNV